MSEDETKIEQAAPSKPEWQRPEIIDVGGLIDLTEAVGGNVNDSPHVAGRVTYRT